MTEGLLLCGEGKRELSEVTFKPRTEERKGPNHVEIWARVRLRKQEERVLVMLWRQQISERKEPEEATDGQKGQLGRWLFPNKLLSLLPVEVGWLVSTLCLNRSNGREAEAMFMLHEHHVSEGAAAGRLGIIPPYHPTKL